jgi:putative RecB family exonuclease
MGVALPYSLSPSAIGAFKDCPLAFKLSYIDRLPQPPSVPASRGTLVHRALELLMVRPPAERTPEAAQADLATAVEELREHPEFAGLELTEDEWAGFCSEASTLVEQYFMLEDPTTVQAIGLELRLQAEVDGVRVRGVIDRLELDEDGELVVTDYKTGAVPNERNELNRLAGVHMYALMVERFFGKRPVRVQLLYLSRPEAIIATPTDQSLSGTARRTNALWQAINRACANDDFRPHPGFLCQWCSYQPYCPSFGGDPTQAIELRGPGTVIENRLPLEAAVSAAS